MSTRLYGKSRTNKVYSRRDFIRQASVAAGGICLGSSLSNAQDTPTQGKPNFVFVLTDDQRWDAMGFMKKYPFLKTPNIDRMRNEGVHFENAFVTHSLCAPSRASFLTGMFSQAHGVSTNQEGREYNPDLTPSFAQILGSNGYKTAFIGKWHMAEHDRPRKGFDHWVSFMGQGMYKGNDLNINGQKVRSEGYITDELTNYALDYIEQANEPFCLYLSHKAVHDPFEPAERHSDEFIDDLVPEPENFKDDLVNKPAWQRTLPTPDQRRRIRASNSVFTSFEKRVAGPWPAKAGVGRQKDYFRSIYAVDEGIGKILTKLESKGLLDNTVVVFAGDNGFFHGEHGRGDKRVAYNESMRIPLVMRYPKAAKVNSTVSQIVLNADIAPTFLELAGVEVPKAMQGKSVVPLLRGKVDGWRKSFLFTYWPDLIAHLPRIVAVRTERYMYAIAPDIDDINELYDIVKDPYEMNNLAIDPKYDNLKGKLQAEMQRLIKETGYKAEVPRPNPEPDWGVKNGLLFDLDFSNLKGDKIKDLSGNGFNGDVTDVSLVSTEKGKAGKFNSCSYVDIAFDRNLDASKGTIVIDCLIKPDSAGGFVVGSGNNIRGWAVFVDQGKPGMLVVHDRYWQFVDSTKSASGKWTRIVAVITNYHNYLDLYVNGEHIGRRRMLLPLHELYAAYGGINIGKDLGEPVDPDVTSKTGFAGLVKHVKIYREKFSDLQLKQMSSL